MCTLFALTIVVENNSKGESPVKTNNPWPTSKMILLACLFVAGLAWTVPCHADVSTKKAKVTSPQKLPEPGKMPAASAAPAPSNPASAQAAAQKPSQDDAASAQQQVQKALMQRNFAYNPKLMVDPFVSFIKPPATLPLEFPAEQGKLPPKPQRPLTPLQKMSLGEVQKGLTAITWGSLGRRAIIQDSAGKGYIVSVGTPAVGRNGVVLRIYSDRLIVRQEVWNSTLERMVYEDNVVKLQKNQSGQ